MTRLSAIAGRQDAAPRGDRVSGQDSATPRHLQRFLVRQPVLDAGYQVAGYELRVRDRVPVPVIPGAQSLQQIHDEMLLVSVIDLEFQRALGNRLTFLALASETLHNPLLEQLPPDKIVLSVDSPEPTPETLAICQALARRGIALALDDCEPSPGIAPLLHACRYLRLDVLRHDIPSLIERIGRLRSLSDARLVARNVETEEVFTACRKLGFDLFQGHFFTCLQPGIQHRIDGSRQRILELLNLVMAHADTPRIEAGFKQDAGLAYKLLRLINSAAFNLQQPVRSIGHALMLLGHDALYRWLTLLLFVHGPVDPRGQALLRNALVRARFAESLSEHRLSPAQRGGLFIAGILSTLDALFNQPMEQVLGQLRLPTEVSGALLRGEGPYAPYLKLALACEDFDQEAIAWYAAEVGLTADQVNLAHVNALIWAERLEV